MAILKCKMCGGDMELAPDKTFGTCEYCGSTMTLPKIEEEQLAAAFNRGNHFRRSGEFDKALSVYERIVEQDDSNAEAHWCCALCRFGIEYVEDPISYEWLPTCHRASFDSFLEDVDYLAALEHSDGITRRQYQKDGAKIAEVQRGILATSRNAEPYDVFISYKELDKDGNRTRDSILAQEIYYQLSEQGRRVFFSRITLEDVPGTEYEPYIFAALNSAKVMIVVGTSGENLSAVWVKNEWSRFLSMMRKDRSKLLLPCYRDMDPYDLPEQLSVLMSYDMGKIGFLQDLIRGVNKVLDADKPRETVKETVKETVVVRNEGGSAGANVSSLIDRGNMALEDKRWEEAKGFFDRALDADSRCGAAYWGLFLAEQRASSPADLLAQQKKALTDARTEKLTACEEDSGRIQAAAENYAVRGYLSVSEIRALFPFDRSYESGLSCRKKQKEQTLAALRQNKNLQRAAQYGDENLKAQVQKLQTELTAILDENIAKARKEEEASIARVRKAYADHLNEAEVKARQQQERALSKKETAYQRACEKEIKAETELSYRAAAEDFDSMGDYKDSPKRAQQCRAKAEELRAKAEAKKKRTIAIKIIAVAAAVAVYLLLTLVILPSIRYNKAETLFAAGEYEAAVAAFEKAGNYKDAAERIPEVCYVYADALLSGGNVAEAETMFAKAGDYKDASTRMPEYYYEQAEALLANGDKPAAAVAFHELSGYLDAAMRSSTIWNEIAVRNTIAAGSSHTVGLRSDGTVLAVGSNYSGKCKVSDWTDIVAIAAGSSHTVGLRTDGTVAAVGYNADGQCNVSGWTDIVAVAAGTDHTVGLRSDGTVVATEYTGNQEYYYGQCEVSDWTDIVAIAAGNGYTVGLRSDGTVVATEYTRNQEYYYGECEVSDWTDIVAIAAGSSHTVGLRSDGKVVAVGGNWDGKCEVSGWTDIVAISAGGRHTVGLRADGTVVATEYTGNQEYYDGECEVSDWTDIVAISGGYHTVGLRSDGTVVAVGDDHYGQCKVSDWTDILVPQNVNG